MFSVHVIFVCIVVLESQLESEHSERSLLLRERHELERRLAALEETARAETHEQGQLVQRLKRYHSLTRSITHSTFHSIQFIQVYIFTLM